MPNNSAEFWTGEIQRAEKFRRKNREPRWRRARQDFRNLWFYDDKGKADRFIKNPDFFSHVKTLVSNIAAYQPKVSVTSMREKYDVDAHFVKTGLQYELRRNDFLKLDRAFVHDLAIYNLAVCKTGYNFSESFMLPPDSLFFARITPFNWLIDPEATAQSNARWEGEKYFITAEEFEAWNESRRSAGLPEFDNFRDALATKTKVVINSEMDKTTPREHESYNEEQLTRDVKASSLYDDTVESADIERIEIYEIYDKVNQERVLLVAGKIKVAADPMPKYILDKKNKSPYSVAQFNTTPDFFYGECDHSIFESKFHEINVISNRILEFTKRMKVLGLARGGAFTKQQLEKISNGKMGGIFEVEKNYQGPMSDALTFVQNAQLAPENAFMLNQLRTTLPQDTGLSDFMKGSAASGGRKTATESQFIQQGAGVRAKERIDIHDEFLDDVVQSAFYVMRHTYTEEKWIAEAGFYPSTRQNLDGSVEVEKNAFNGELIKKHLAGFLLTPAMLQAELYIRVEAGSSSDYNNYVKQQTNLNYANTLARIPPLAQLTNWEVVARDLAKSFDHEPDEVVLLPQMPPTPPPGAPAGMPSPGGPPSMGSQTGVPGDVLNSIQRQIQTQSQAPSAPGGPGA